MDSQTKTRIAITSVFAVVGALIVGPLLLPARVVTLSLLVVGAACFVAVYVIKAVVWVRERNASKASRDVVEPRSNIQVLPAPSISRDGDS